MELLKKERAVIDDIDKKLVELLKKRLEAVKKIKHIKKDNNLLILDAKREKEVLDNLQTEEEFIKNIFKEILNQSKKIQK